MQVNMKRRSVLATTGLSVFIGLGGCAEFLSQCPAPDINEELSYENHRIEDSGGYTGDDIALLFTSAPEINDELERVLNEEGIEFVTGTDFDEYSVVIVQVGSSVGSSDLEVLGVGHEDQATIRVYTCVADESGTDDWYPRTQVLRVDHEGQVPERAVGTHFREDTEVTFNKSD
jgi:hypothetical protein